jgi:magnesium-transporting ATPase (P-type)
MEALVSRIPENTERQNADGSYTRVINSQLSVGDIVRVNTGEAFPADGLLLSGQTKVDESLLTGESTPIHKNKGNAVNVQLEEAPQIVMAIASPAGLLENSSIPSHAVPASVSPTHTPPAKKPKSETINNVTIKISFMALLLLHVRTGLIATYAANQ